MPYVRAVGCLSDSQQCYIRRRGFGMHCLANTIILEASNLIQSNGMIEQGVGGWVALLSARSKAGRKARFSAHYFVQLAASSHLGLLRPSLHIFKRNPVGI